MAQGITGNITAAEAGNARVAEAGNIRIADAIPEQLVNMRLRRSRGLKMSLRHMKQH
jgi:hypothetical protein